VDPGETIIVGAAVLVALILTDILAPSTSENVGLEPKFTA
jgi:hypothetical protein